MRSPEASRNAARAARAALAARRGAAAMGARLSAVVGGMRYCGARHRLACHGYSRGKCIVAVVSVDPVGCILSHGGCRPNSYCGEAEGHQVREGH